MFKKIQKKDLGLSPEQSQLIIQEAYTTELLLDNNYYTVAKDAFKGNPDGYSVVDKVCSAIAKLDYRVYKGLANGKKKYIDNHPFLKLIARPNPDRGKYEYMYELILFFLLSGQGFQRKIDIAKVPARLYSCRPDRMGMFLSKTKQQGWYFEFAGKQVSYKIDEISYVRIPDPLDDFLGFSPLRAAAYNIDGNNANDRWNFSMIQNGARPSGILKTSQVLNETVLARLKKVLLNSWAGKYNTGKAHVLEAGLEWQQISLSQKDMDNINYAKLNSRKIAQVLNVPNELLGDPEAKTYSNYKEANKAFYKDCVLSLAQRFIDEWNNWLMPAWGEGLYIEVDKDKIEALREDRDLLTQRVIGQFNSGIITRAEAR